MVLVDTSVWVTHLRHGNARLAQLLEEGEVLCHSAVVVELACGHLRNRAEILNLLQHLPQAPVLAAPDLLSFIEQHRLAGQGVGMADVHLLAAAVRTESNLWTLDKALANAASRLRCAFR